MKRRQAVGPGLSPLAAVGPRRRTSVDT